MIFMHNIDDFDFAELKMFIFGEKALDVEQNEQEHMQTHQQVFILCSFVVKKH